MLPIRRDLRRGGPGEYSDRADHPSEEKAQDRHPKGRRGLLKAQHPRPAAKARPGPRAVHAEEEQHQGAHGGDQLHGGPPARPRGAATSRERWYSAASRSRSSAPAKTVTEKQLAWWKRDAKRHGLDASVEPNRRSFQALPVLRDLNCKLGT